MTATVKLYNRGKRTVLGVHSDKVDADGVKAPFAFAPESAMEFSREDAMNIRKLYPTEVVDMDGVTREFEEKTKASNAAAAMISVSEAEKAKKNAVAEAIQQAVNDALEKNNAMHEAARIAMEQKSKEDLDVAMALAEEKTALAPDESDDDKFAKMNTVDKVISGKKKS
jgi:hypothetical protein